MSKEIFDAAITEFNLGNFKKASILFDQVLAVEPQHIVSLIKKGNILGKFARYFDAITYYDMALDIEPQNILALINKGLALHYLTKYEDAILCYDVVLGIKQNNAIALYNKASSLARLGRIPESLEVLQKAIELDYSYKYKARQDIDFEHIKKSNEFKKIVL